MPTPHRHRPLPRARHATSRALTWLAHAPTRLTHTIRDHGRARDERGATAIEWAIFAILAITIAGIVAAAITAAVNNRLPGIQ
jgi:Flp pilus assembly pilin Flp